MSIKSSIIVRFQLEGFHNFPAARELFPEVSFLSFRHRHIFHFECKKQVLHDDRDVEFILFKREIQNYLIEEYGSNQWGGHPSMMYCEFGPMSCEMIARELLEKFDLESASVFEDGENGALLERI